MSDTMFHNEEEEEHPRASSLSIASTDTSRFESNNVEKTAETNRALSRVASRRSSILPERAEYALATIRSRRPIAPFAHPLSLAKTGPDVIVTFDGPDDPYKPLNWSFKKKVVTTTLYGFTTMGATWASAVYSPGIIQIAQDFHVGTEVSTLGLTLLLFGFGVGPMLWAPLSEVYGRKIAVLLPYFVATIFAFGTATAKDIQTVLITRFFAGFFGSAPITNTGG